MTAETRASDPVGLREQRSPTERPAQVELSIDQVTVRYDRVVAVDGVSLDIAPGEFVSLLGPSGSGKTTLLRTIAGFTKVDSGRILLKGCDISRTPPRLRNFGMVFQRYALFPHMTVEQNVAFGLKTRRIPRHLRRGHVQAALETVGLGDAGQRYPDQLSGGQQQRVALARAIVIRPALLLMDEPLGALDQRLREEMQVEIRSLQRRLGITTLYVTHDQEEALSMSDRVVVMNRGRISGVGQPEELYTSPATVFVASFVGHNTIIRIDAQSLADQKQVEGLPGQCRGFRASRRLAEGTDTVALVLSPDQIECHPSPIGGASRGSVTGKRFTGLTALLDVEVADQTLRVLAPREVPALGQEVYVRWDPVNACLLEDGCSDEARRQVEREGRLAASVDPVPRAHT